MRSSRPRPSETLSRPSEHRSEHRAAGRARGWIARHADVVSLTFVGVALASQGCGPEPHAQPEVPSAPGTPGTPSGATATSARPAGPEAGATPAMPSAIARCEATGQHLGGFAPTVADLRAALAALPVEPCLKRDVAADAVAACAAKLGATSMTLSTDALGGSKSGCQVTIQGAASGGRRWIVFDELHRDGATFFGGSNVIELTPSGPVHYLGAFGGKHAELCPSTSTTGAPVRPADLPPGWTNLPETVRQFLCSGAD